ncbi:putative aminotransferase YcbU [Diplonema papillatum]|nr:putative aminotransferase YcbU [Diplonema papillatum]
MAAPLKCQRHLFRLPRDEVFLNCAYMGPLTKEAERAGIAGLRRKRAPTRIRAEDFFNDPLLLRLEFAKLLAGEHSRGSDAGFVSSIAQQVAIVPSASYGVANAAANARHVRKGSRIVVVGNQFPSNYYPWTTLAHRTGATVTVVDRPSTSPGGQTSSIAAQWNEQLLDAIDASVAVIAVDPLHWADGTLFDLHALRKRADEVGAWLVTDATQCLGAMPLDFEGIAPDVLVCASYKWLLGPYSLGLAYYSERVTQDAEPIEESWTNRVRSDDFANLRLETEYRPGAARFEMGERANFIHVPMLLAALRQINAWSPAAVSAYCGQLADATRALSRLSSAGYSYETDSRFRTPHLFGIRVPPRVSEDAIKRAMQERSIHVSLRGDALRISPHVYNTKRDMNKLVDALLAL